MTREEAKKVFEYLEKKANTQEPCTDTVSIRKDILKCRVGNIVAYNVEWLKKNWQMEMDIVCGVKPCDDAISRQAVLASIKNLYPDMPVINIMGSRRKWLEKYAPYFECENAVEHLPSVTPQKSESVTEFADRCRECGARYGKLLEQKSGKWIPFSEGLPKPFEYCLITTTDGEVIYHYDDGHYSKYKAWMPLPEPYEPQERSDKE